jgi:hypothetical protein
LFDIGGNALFDMMTIYLFIHRALHYLFKIHHYGSTAGFSLPVAIFKPLSALLRLEQSEAFRNAYQKERL